MDLWNYLKNTHKPIVLYGTGNGADRILDELERTGVKPSGIFASDGFVRNRSFRGLKVEKYSALEQRLGSMIILTAFGTQREEVISYVRELSKKQELYFPDVPVYGEGVFNYEYAREHKKEITAVYNMLGDEKSKTVYESIIKFKLYGKTDYLFGCQSEPQEAYENILRLKSDEIFMDLGAFNGDTVIEFLKYSGGCKKIYAAEPDRRSFKRLCENTAGLDNIERLNIAVSDGEGSAFFKMRGGRCSAAVSSGVPVQTKSVDGILSGEAVSFIKMDVEGEERKAISGAENTIKKYKPKMLISAYHRAEDIFSLPYEVMKIRDDYKLYIRHYNCIPAWDTNFYFV